MSRRRTSAIVAAIVAAVLLAAWWAQREPGGRLPVVAPRSGAVGASEQGDGSESLAEVTAAEAMRATREVAPVAEGEEAGEDDAGEAELVATRFRAAEEEKPPAPRYGRIVDASTGRPLSQAYVVHGDGAWHGEVVPDRALARCDGNGRFTLSIVSARSLGNATKIAVAAGFETWNVLVAVADGYERHAFDPKQLSDDAGAPTEIAVARGATLLARVVDWHGLPQFDVDIDLIASHQGRLWICAATDELGEVRFVGLPPGIEFEVTLRPRPPPMFKPPVPSRCTVGRSAALAISTYCAACSTRVEATRKSGLFVIASITKASS